MSARPYVIGVMAVAAGLVGIGELADATLTTHESLPADSRTVVVVHGSTVEEGEFALENGIESLVRYCQLEVGRRLGSERLVPLAPDRFELTFTPGLDDADQDQFAGCVGDIVVDHLQASVESYTYISAP